MTSNQPPQDHARPETLAHLASLILITDPAGLTGAAYVDYGSRNARLMLTPPQGASLCDVTTRFFSLMEILEPALNAGQISGRADRHQFTAALTPGNASSHERIKAYETLMDRLCAGGMARAEAELRLSSHDVPR